MAPSAQGSRGNNRNGGKKKSKPSGWRREAKATEQQIESDQATPALMLTALNVDTSTKHNSNCHGSIIFPLLQNIAICSQAGDIVITKITTLGCHAPLA